MKILLYISTLEGGGAARVMVNLANRFSCDGDDVYLVTNLDKDSAYQINHKVHRICIDDRTYPSKFYKNYYRVIKLRGIIKRVKPSVVLSFMTENNIRCIVSTFGIKVKKVVSVRSDPTKECGTGLKGSIIRLIYSFANGVVCQTPDALSWFNKRTQKKGTVILNQVGDSYYEQKRSDSDEEGIISAGRFVDAKNHKMLIKAYSRIVKYIDDDLIIYGDGELRESYSQLICELGIEDRVHLPGNVPNMRDCYDRAKVFVLTSNYEGLPNVVMEAMVRGVPVIATDCPCGGPSLLLNSGEYGILINVDDDEMLAEQLLSLVKNENLRNEYKKRMEKRVEDFRSDIVFKQWKEYLYQN